MNGTDGINSLGKLLGSLTGNESNVAKAGQAAATQATSAATQRAGTTASSNALSADQYQMSAAAGLVSGATNETDVRMDKVASLQQAIASGSYQVSASDVADKMVEGLLTKR